MKVGVTGHQRREGIDWLWVENELRRAFASLESPVDAYGSLAEGADQLFARVALEVGANMFAIIPKDDYEKHFAGPAKSRYSELLSQSIVENMALNCPDEEAFLNAGQRIVDEVDLLFAVWDGKPARGKGGTAEIVAYALRVGKRVRHLDPIRKRVSEL